MRNSPGGPTALPARVAAAGRVPSELPVGKIQGLTLAGAYVDGLVAMFRGVDWTDRHAVEQRVADLHALDSD